MADSSLRTYRELGPWLVLGALCVVVLSTCLSGSCPLACIVFVACTLQGTSSAIAQVTPPPSQIPTGASPFALYEQGSYQAAADRFAQELLSNPVDRALKHGLASSLYRLGKYGESEKLFAELAAHASNGRHYYEAVYNQANAQLKAKRYREAIDSFLKALDVKPDDEPASHNLAVARALLEEEKRRALEPTPTPTATPTATPTSESEPSPETSPSVPPEPSQSPSPSPATSPEPRDSPEQDDQPTPADGTAQPTSSTPPDKDEGTTRTAEADSTPKDPTGVPTSEAMATVNQSPSTPAQAEDRLKEALNKEPEPQQLAAPTASALPESSSFPEVDAWLESLPESPLLIRRHRGSPPTNGQTW